MNPKDLGYLEAPAPPEGYADGASWDWLRAQIRDIVVRRVGSETELEKEAFLMAMGGENSCELARDSQLHEELLQLLRKWIEGQDLSEKDLLAIHRASLSELPRTPTSSKSRPIPEAG